MSDTDLTTVPEMDAQALAAAADKLAMAGQEQASAAGGLPLISTKGGFFTFPDGHVEKGPLTFVILGARRINQLWKLTYDEASRTNARNGMICAAISGPDLNQDTMVSFPGATERQAEQCDICPQNQWVEEGGRRKKSGECKNGLAFIVMAPDLVDQSIYQLNMSALGIKEGIKVLNELKSKYPPHSIKGTAVFDFVQTPRGSARVSVAAGGPNPLWANHTQFMDQADLLIQSEPRWYTGESAPATAAAAQGASTPQEQPAPASSGRKSRSAAK